MRVGLYRQVHVKDRARQELRLPLTARRTPLDHANRFGATVRGTLNAFRLKVGV